MKTCKNCGKSKTKDEFHKNKSLKDGLNSKCKDCQNAHSKKYRQKRSSRNKNVPDVKTCPSCQIEKTAKEFYKSKYSADGLRSQCTKCEIKEVDDYRQRTKQNEKIEVTSKRCYNCDTEKDVDEFHKNDSAIDGLQYICKPCNHQRRKEVALQRRENHPGSKMCDKCRKEKLVVNFTKFLGYDGYDNICKDCRRTDKDNNRKKEGTKLCNNCQNYFDVSNFSKSSKNSDGLHNECVECSRKRSTDHRLRNPNLFRHSCAKRRAQKLQATPPWADEEAIKQVYFNCPEGYHVDHIIPLKGKEVCGLHTPENLQYLTMEENLSKNNQLMEEFPTTNNSDEEFTSMENE